MASLLEILREDTTQLHQALHVHPVLKSCQEGTMDRAEYTHLLIAFYAPWKRLAPAIDLVPIAPLRPKLRSRAQTIREDLEKLHVDRNIFSTNIAEPVPTTEELLGMCYVMIGSSMGASILSAKIKESLGEVPVSYLSMSPKEAGWPELVSALRTLDAKEYSAASTAACAAFAQIGQELTLRNDH